MATTTTRYTVEFSTDPDDKDYPWVILDPDGDYYDQYNNRPEAERVARDANRDLDIERREERLSTLRDAIADEVCYVEDADTLEAILAMVRAKR